MGSPLAHRPPVDVPLSVLDQTPPNTAGPIGRLTTLVNCMVTKYLAATATPGVATGARVKIEQREAFRSLTTTIRDSFDGSVITPAWGPAQLLDSLDDQLVSIDNSIPRVYNGTSWSGYPRNRVITRKLQQSVVHTANGIMQAPDSAWLGGVTCVTWETGQNPTSTAGTVWLGFRSDDGAWVTTPGFVSITGTMSKVVQDGTHFWVFFWNKAISAMAVRVYDTNGVLISSDTSIAGLGSADENYDIVALSGGGALFAALGASSHIRFSTVTVSGSTITVTSNTDATTACDGNLAFVRNPVNALSYVVATNGTALNGYEITAMASTHAYSLPAHGGTDVLDSLIGWVNAGLDLFVSYGILSPAQSQGPTFDPRARKTVTVECTRGGSASTIKTTHSVIPVSRAFQVDDDWYAVAYYQGGSGLFQNGSTGTVTWTTGDKMKGPAVQNLRFSPGDYQYGNVVTPVRNASDFVQVFPSNVNYTIFNVPPAIAAMTGAQLAEVYQAGAKIIISGASHGANNNSFYITNMQFTAAGQLLIQTAVGAQINENFGPAVSITFQPSDGTLSPNPDLRDCWSISDLSGTFPDASWVGENLFVSGTSQAVNWGANAITDVGIVTNRAIIKLGSSAGLLPEFIPNPVQPTAVLELQLADPSTAYQFTLQSVTFTTGMIGGTISVQNSGILGDNTVYEIVQITGTHTCIATPINGSTNQANVAFKNTVKITLSIPSNATASLQPTWFMIPLAVTTQTTVGRWEYGLAYADWRYDGASDTVTSLYPFDVFSVVATNAGLQVILPYRAESFSAGVTAPTGNPVDTFFSTVGLKAFTLSTTPGQSLTVGGELIIPGPQASEFTSSAFAEQGISLGPETPFFLSQTVDSGIPIGLTGGTTYEYRIVFESTDEDGDRIFTPPSRFLSVTLAAGNNTINIGGNMPTLTQRVVQVAIYRTSIAGGSTTVQHYKITNDTDPFGAGFTFPDVNTWNFKDQRPDAEILVSEVLYTDKGFKPRFPCPAFIQGVGTWRNRTWVIGYDGAVWMSGEKTEGDAVWFTPDYRFLLPTDDEPTCLAAMDDYLIVLAAASNWYIPAVVFPDATGNNGQLPAPVQLPFANGCTGYAVTTRDGVIYSSTAGGAWLIPRNLTNGWLSQAIQQSLGLTAISGMAVDENQRVLISTGGSNNPNAYVWDTVPGAWYQWVLPSFGRVVAEWNGHFVYADGLRVNQHTPGSYADNIGASDIAVPPSWTLAPIHLMGSVRGYGRCWAIQLQGDYQAPHFMNLTLGYGDERDYQAPTVFPPKAASATLSYLYEWNPAEEEASQFEVSFAVTFANGVAGNSATWELLSFDVGVDTGIARVASQKRIASGG